MRARLIGGVLAAIVLVSTPGLATTSKQKIEEAKPHFSKAVELYDENDFAGALIEFKRAYEISQDFHVLFNMAQTYYQLQNYAGALDSFQRYLTEADPTLTRDRRTYVEKELQKLRGRVAQVRVTVNVAGAEISVDDEKVGTAPLDKPLTVSQGKRKISALVAGKPVATKTIEVAGGDSTSIELSIESDVTTPPPPLPPPIIEGHAKVPIVPWIVTGGLFIGAAVTGTLALVFSQGAKDKINTYGVSADDIKGAQNTAFAFGVTSDIFSGCTLIAAGVALVVTLVAKPQPVERAAKVHWSVGPQGVAIFGAF